LYCATDGSLAFRIRRSVAGDVQQHRQAVAARALHESACHEARRCVVHCVPRDEVAHAPELRALEGRLVEHRGLLIADATRSAVRAWAAPGTSSGEREQDNASGHPCANPARRAAVAVRRPNADSQ
jgi:hypothetical protein